MRRTLIIGTVLVALFASAPSHARTRTVSKKNILFKTQAPCLVACAHNMESNVSIIDEAGQGNPLAGQFSPCGKPGPAGSYADVVVTVPKLVNTLVFSIFPRGDWDSYICSKPTRGASREVANGANSYPSDIPPASQDLSGPLGIKETSVIPVKPGQKYILRAYNWADNASCPGEYRFLYVS